MSMTRQEQLDAVARNVYEWSNKPELDVVQVLPELNTVAFCNSTLVTDCEYHLFTREEVEARKAELQNKPSWDDAPEWCNWSAQDSNGNWDWFAEKPTPEHDDGYWCADVFTFRSGEVIGDWRDTLEKRPAADEQPEQEDFNTSESHNSDEVFGKNLSVYSDDSYKWGREDLPPAGTICECRFFRHRGYEKVKVLDASNGKHCVCVTVNHDGSYGQTFWGSDFRPIKSVREECVDALVSVIMDYYGNPKGSESYLGLANSIYNSGLVKLPETDGIKSTPEPCRLTEL